MPSPSSVKRKYSERSNYGFTRARDVAFAAIRELWDQRQKSGMKQSDIAFILGRDKAWVSRQLSGPGNWTLRTLGELCEALDGELEIVAHRIEVPAAPHSNHHAYAGYGEKPVVSAPQNSRVVNFRKEPVASSASKVIEAVR